MAAATAVGDKTPIFVTIRKGQKPRCIKNEKFLSSRYRHQKKRDGWGTVWRLGARIRLTVWKVSKYGVISGPYFPVFGAEITSYLNTFHAVKFFIRIKKCGTVIHSYPAHPHIEN